MLFNKIFFYLSVIVLFQIASSFVFNPRLVNSKFSSSALKAVTEVISIEEFDAAIKGSSELVVIDYSTTWCGPCKIGMHNSSSRNNFI